MDTKEINRLFPEEKTRIPFPLLAVDIPKVAAQEQGERHKYYPRASNAGLGKCIRESVYQGLGIEGKPFPGRTMLIFSDSSFHEDLTNDWIRKTAYKLHSEQMELEIFKVNGFVVKGHIDGIVTDMLGWDFLYEHKALNHFTFGMYEMGELALDYITQCCMYLVGLRKASNDLDRAIILIKNKNTAQYMQFNLIYNFEKDVALIMLGVADGKERGDRLGIVENVVIGAKKRYEDIDEYIAKKTLPKRQYDMGHWRCTYCGWGGICYANYKKEFEELTTDIEIAEDMHDLIGYYLESEMHCKEMARERDGLRDQAKMLLKEQNARKGRVTIKQPVIKNGQEKMINVTYILERILKTKRMTDKLQIPVEILKKATVTKVSEMFQIRKITEKERKEEAKKKFGF